MSHKNSLGRRHGSEHELQPYRLALDLLKHNRVTEAMFMLQRSTSVLR